MLGECIPPLTCDHYLIGDLSSVKEWLYMLFKVVFCLPLSSNRVDEHQEVSLWSFYRAICTWHCYCRVIVFVKTTIVLLLEHNVYCIILHFVRAYDNVVNHKHRKGAQGAQ